MYFLITGLKNCKIYSMFDIQYPSTHLFDFKIIIKSQPPLKKIELLTNKKPM